MSDVNFARAPWWLRWLYLGIIYAVHYRYHLLLGTVLAGLGWGMWVFGHR